MLTCCLKDKPEGSPFLSEMGMRPFEWITAFPLGSLIGGSVKSLAV